VESFFGRQVPRRPRLTCYSKRAGGDKGYNKKQNFISGKSPLVGQKLQVCVIREREVVFQELSSGILWAVVIDI
jgi:hypothetical protein